MRRAALLLVACACGGAPQPSAPTSTSSTGGAAPGHVPPETLQNVVRGAGPAIRACYQKGLSRNAHLEGRITVRFVIAENGTVASALDIHDLEPREDPRFEDAEVVTCVLDEISKLKFPPPPGGPVNVVLPVNLAPGM